uniref:Prokineticin 2 n=1 Tax=Pseudonaja textilis TaxID=8673 RepID=A0A670Y0E0_PSETE
MSLVPRRMNVILATHSPQLSLLPHPWDACDRDLQCGGGMCCAVSLWIQSLRICTPMGIFGEDCHPLSHKVPFWGRRMHHSCPCEPNLACVQISPSKYKCLPEFKNDDIYF